jgi:hypothetical protein
MRGMWIATVENIDWPNQARNRRRSTAANTALDAGQRAGPQRCKQANPPASMLYKSDIEP